mmetsp:Transcript_35070/g.76761  ORF Transcript_35070/g.76761 Transcript_35070/m.76761 type:complete len:479 (-) Transcript_35070:111-1547(-)
MMLQPRCFRSFIAIILSSSAATIVILLLSITSAPSALDYLDETQLWPSLFGDGGGGESASQSSQSITLTPFEEHYLSIYQSAMMHKTTQPKFILFRMSTHGLGNKLRTLSGAMFLAAITDRVLLVDSDVIASLFDPPELNGVTLDWNASLANGTCDSADPRTAHTLNMAIKRSEYTPHFVNFHERYSHISCLIVGSSFGHDRQVATLNERTYKSKVEHLFGHATSRLIWSKATMGLIMQRPKQRFADLGKEQMDRLGISRIPFENRVAVHFRTFRDLAEESQQEILNAKTKYWECVVPLVQSLVEERGKLSILAVSDNDGVKEEAKANLGVIPGVDIIDAGLSFVHSSGVGDLDAHLEWFLVGECSTVISTGYSSYGITAYFRPSHYPPANVDKKRLFTVDGLSKSFFANNRNNPCGEVVASGYADINIGFYDPLHRPLDVARALKDLESIVSEKGRGRPRLQVGRLSRRLRSITFSI